MMRTCAQPGVALGDRCLSNSPDEVYSIALAGKSSTLVRVDGGNASTNPKEFRLESDPFWRVRLYNSGGASLLDKAEYWTVETPDGTTYELGRTDDSVDWVPVYDTAGCSEQYALCVMGYKWNVNNATDAFGNEMDWVYAQEMNMYRARQISTSYKREFVRASRPISITYGGKPGTQAANARVVFEYEYRCGHSNVFGDCEEGDDFLDVPEDLWCKQFASTCTEYVPAFFTHVRLSGVLSQVAGATAGSWVTTAHHDLEQSFNRDTTVPETDSSQQLVLYSLQERPVDGNGAGSAGGTYEHYGFDRMLAAERDVQSGTIIKQHDDLGSTEVVHGINNNNWIRFEDVYLGESPGRATNITFRAAYYKQKTGARLEFRKGGAGGDLLGTYTFTAADHNSSQHHYKTFNFNITAASGVEDVVVLAKASQSGNFLRLHSVQFGRNEFSNLAEVGEVDYKSGAFDWRDNRLNHPGGVSAMRFPRIKKITNQLGGTIEFAYGQDHACAQNVAVPPGSWDNNQLDCFPQWDTSSSPNGFTIFNKWVVKTMTRKGDVSGGGYADPVVTNYAYGDTGWAFSDNPDSSNDTWNEFRGYKQSHGN